MTHAGRADTIRAALGDCDALVVSDLTNVRWLTGFTGSNGWAVLTPGSLTLVTDGRYGVQAEVQMAEAGVSGSVRVGLTAVETLAKQARPKTALETADFFICIPSK